MNVVKETICTGCAHRNVCAYKDDWLSVIEAVSRSTVNKQLPDGTVEMTPIKNFDFIEDVSITCRYYYNLDYTISQATNQRLKKLY